MIPVVLVIAVVGAIVVGRLGTVIKQDLLKDTKKPQA